MKSIKKIPRCAGNTSKQGYFKAPDCVFDLPLSAHAKLILLYLSRRADQTGFSFPSQERICKDCSIKSRTTIDKAVKELKKAGLVKQAHSKGRWNTYQLSERVLAIIRTCPRDGQPPVHQVDTKEYTYKEDTHKEGMCVLNNSQLEGLEKKWIETFNTTYNRETTEPLKSLRGNLEAVCAEVAKKLPALNAAEVFNHSIGLVEWYLTADEGSSPRKGNEWIYKGERKSSRLAKNFEIVWCDYWAVNQPIREWKTPQEYYTGEGVVSQEKLKETLDSLEWYQDYKKRKSEHNN